MIKILLILGLALVGYGVFAGNKPIDSYPKANGLPADSVLAETKTIAGVTLSVYSSASGFFVQFPFSGGVRTVGPLSNLDVTRILQLQGILSGL